LYAIIDIETSGGSRVDKITEIAIIIHNGTKITDEFSTLINPEVSIPYFITNLTGITNQMVEHAPKFHEVAKKIVEMTHDKIFVAHNASFDYHFIKSEFKNLGYDFKRRTMCTVKLSRKLIPALNSYSLGNLCADLDIEVVDRHRAMGDARATAKLFEYLLAINGNEIDLFAKQRISSMSNLHPDLDINKIETLPEESGVYYFFDDRKDLIYVGKSKNIYGRVLSHFNNFKTKKSVNMRDAIADIDHVQTGSELIALLMESDEIKKYTPLFNRQQRRTNYTYGIFTSVNEHGYQCMSVDKIKGDEMPVTTFHSQDAARGKMEALMEQYHLCQKLCGLYEAQGACFHHSIRLCNGACIGQEDVEAYNQRVKAALRNFEFKEKNFFIIDKGRSLQERSVVKIENGCYRGFGYLDVSNPVSGIEALNDCITRYQDNADVQQIIRTYLKLHKVEKIIKY
jgi:DNA polymerase-3 subunit epsilon